MTGKDDEEWKTRAMLQDIGMLADEPGVDVTMMVPEDHPDREMIERKTAKRNAIRKIAAVRRHIGDLDRKHIDFAQDVVNGWTWKKRAFSALAKKHGLKAENALDRLNEWSVETVGVDMIDEYADGYRVSSEAGEKIVKLLKKHGIRFMPADTT